MNYTDSISFFFFFLDVMNFFTYLSLRNIHKAHENKILNRVNCTKLFPSPPHQSFYAPALKDRTLQR